MKFDVAKLLDYINPSQVNYQQWLEIGMALKHEGYTVDYWDEWSRRDGGRYNEGETERKWSSFQDTGITGATITQLAKENGWESYSDKKHGALDWNSTIADERLVVVDHSYLEKKEVFEPSDEQFKPHEQMIEYLNTLFDSDDYVGYVTKSWYQEEAQKHLPTEGVYARQAGQIIEELNKYSDDVGYAVGDYNAEAGAWIRFNPLDGQGVNNSNVTEFRYTLVESDDDDIEKQNAILRELELPIAMLVHSGNESLHAIVKVDANSLQQYKERVDYIYNVCMQNGLNVDTQNRNPSRLSRWPGFYRNGNKQFIVDKNIGQPNYDEWAEWIESVNDDLPDPESLADVWDDMPPKSPQLIHGLLRQGHKMLIAGPSKAGKSYMLINLCISLAEGMPWLGWPTERGKVLYVNLELDAPSAFHRFKDVYQALGYAPNHISNIDIWNLRGKAVPMDKLAPKLIRRAEKEDYIAIVIDPIYKVLTGDENSAEDMALFTNQFDKIATELDTAVIYCHHHSKGAQGGKKSMDRSSGSGVFARDPDAIIDLAELDITEGVKQQQKDVAAAEVYVKWIKEKNPTYFDTYVGLDDQLSVSAMDDHAKKALNKDDLMTMGIETLQAASDSEGRSAWRLEGTLREFKSFEARNMWFDFPVHRLDESDLLINAEVGADLPVWKKGSQGNKDSKKSRKEERMEALEEAFNSTKENGKASIEDVADAIGKSDRTIRSHVKEHDVYQIEDGFIIIKEK